MPRRPPRTAPPAHHPHAVARRRPPSSRRRPLTVPSAATAISTSPSACGRPSSAAKNAGTDPEPRSSDWSPHQIWSQSRSASASAAATSTEDSSASTRNSPGLCRTRRERFEAPHLIAPGPQSRPRRHPRAPPRPAAPARARRGRRGSLPTWRGCVRTSTPSGSGRRSTHFTQAAMRIANASRAPEDDAVTALRVRPLDRAFLVADHVARAALEALLVVEQDPAVGRGDEQVRRAGHDTVTSNSHGTRRHRRRCGAARGRGTRPCPCAARRRRRARPVGCSPEAPPAAKAVVQQVPPPEARRLRSSRRMRRRPGFGWGLSMRNIRSTTLATIDG